MLAVVVHAVSAIQIRSGNLLPHPCDNLALRSSIAVCILFILCWTPIIVALGLSVVRTVILYCIIYYLSPIRNANTFFSIPHLVSNSSVQKSTVLSND